MKPKLHTDIPVPYLHECLRVEPDGTLYWKSRPRSQFTRQQSWALAQRVAGKRAGYREAIGYTKVGLAYGGAKFAIFAHRIVWAMHTGAWPTMLVDHINRDRTDNRISNLREVANDENLRNNGNPRGTGLLGAYRSGSRFMSQLQHPYRYLGLFDTALEAHQAYMSAFAERGADSK